MNINGENSYHGSRKRDKQAAEQRARNLKKQPARKDTRKRNREGHPPCQKNPYGHRFGGNWKPFLYKRRDRSLQPFRGPQITVHSPREVVAIIGKQVGIQPMLNPNGFHACLTQASVKLALICSVARGKTDQRRTQ